MLTTVDDIIERVQIGMGTSSGLLTEEGYEAAVDEALAELDYTLPITEFIRASWTIKRAKRHALFILYIESANRFQYKQIRLNHRFDHYHKIIESMDKEYQKALEEDWMDFLDCDPNHLFGTKIAAGFAYNVFGEDRTYDFANYVNFAPKAE
jgi:hypothetical protein